MVSTMSDELVSLLLFTRLDSPLALAHLTSLHKLRTACRSAFRAHLKGLHLTHTTSPSRTRAQRSCS